VLDCTIECSPHAPADARQAVGELAGSVAREILRDAQLLVSELVTNSVRHSGSPEPIQLRAWTRSGGLKVEIADGGRGFEADSASVAHDSEGGRGLMILEALAERWGVSRDARSRVWFEIALPVPGAVRAG
jgi:anti-sigma regulatory factor (Ser/Thr protein kinase)